jgi:hypothetical protein
MSDKSYCYRYLTTATDVWQELLLQISDNSYWCLTRVTATDIWQQLLTSDKSCCYRYLTTATAVWQELLLQISDNYWRLARITATYIWQQLLFQMSDDWLWQVSDNIHCNKCFVRIMSTATDICYRYLIEELLLHMPDTSYCQWFMIQYLLLHMSDRRVLPDNCGFSLWEKNTNTILRQCFRRIIYATENLT